MAVGYTIVSVPVTAQSATYWSQTDAGSVSTVGTNYYYGQPSYNYNPDGTIDYGDIPLKLIIEPQNPTESAVSAVEFTMAGQDYDEVAQQEPLNGFTWFAGNSSESWPLPENIEKVQFWDSGVPGQVGNTVVVYAWLNPNFSVPYNDVEITLDIDGDVVPITSTPINPAQIEFLSCPYQTGPDSAGYNLTGWYSGWPNVISDYVTYTITNPCTDCFESNLDYVNGVPGSGSVNNVLLGLGSIWTSSVFEIPFANSSTTQESCWTITLDPYSTNGVPTGSPSCTVCQTAQEPPEQIIYGCMDDGGTAAGGTWATPLYPGISATNFDENATNHMQSTCEYPEIQGCTDPNASNYMFLATEDDGSCIYPFQNAQGYMKISVVVEACSNLTVCSTLRPRDAQKRVYKPDIGMYVYANGPVSTTIYNPVTNNNLHYKTLDWLENINSTWDPSPWTNVALSNIPFFLEDEENPNNIVTDVSFDGGIEQATWVHNGDNTGCDGGVFNTESGADGLFSTYVDSGDLYNIGGLSNADCDCDNPTSACDGFFKIAESCNTMTWQVDPDAASQYQAVVSSWNVTQPSPLMEFLILPNPGYTLSRHNLWVETPPANADDPSITGLPNPNWTGVPDGLLENYQNVQVSWGHTSYSRPVASTNEELLDVSPSNIYGTSIPEIPIDPEDEALIGFQPGVGNTIPFGDQWYSPYASAGPTPLTREFNYAGGLVESDGIPWVVNNIEYTTCANYLGTTFPSNVDNPPPLAETSSTETSTVLGNAFSAFNATGSAFVVTNLDQVSDPENYGFYSNYQCLKAYSYSGGNQYNWRGNIRLMDTMYSGSDPLEPYVTESNFSVSGYVWKPHVPDGYGWTPPGNPDNNPQYEHITGTGRWESSPETWFNEDEIDPQTYEGNAVKVSFATRFNLSLFNTGVRHLVVKIRGKAMPCETCGENNTTFNESITVSND